MASTDKPDTNAGGIAASAASIIEAVYKFGKLLLAIVVLVILWHNRGLIGGYLDREWLHNVDSISFMGLSVERKIAADASIDEIAKRSNPLLPTINRSYARGAVERASVNASAMAGARILWVDSHPENNQEEANILMNFGIDIRRALSTKEALILLPGYDPDLIIADIGRDADADDRLPLQNCPAHYFDLPIGLSGNLDELNNVTMAGTGKVAGFGMAEAISKEFPKYTDHFQSRLIFYSASNGGRVSDQCARIITNRADILLQTVVSALEEFRWEKLPTPR